MHPIINEDALSIASSQLPWGKVQNKSILISGANGYVPAYFVHALLKRNDLFGDNIRVISLCRNQERATKRFEQYLNRKDFYLHIADVQNKINIEENIDFFIHAASPAGITSRHEKPANTFQTNVLGCSNMLELARKNKPEGFLFISSVDMYGTLRDSQNRILETDAGVLDPLKVYNAYGCGKRAAETMCACYCTQYNIPVTIARPFQIVGPGVWENDGRVHIDFIFQLKSNNGIILKSDGSAKRSFVYISDATIAMLQILLLGQPGQAYNVANEQGERTVYELAQDMVALLAEKKATITFDITQRETAVVKNAISQVTGDTSKLQALGWNPDTTLDDMLKRTMKYYELL